MTWDEMVESVAKKRWESSSGSRWTRASDAAKKAMRREADATLRALRAAGVVMVPATPTDAMIIAAGEAASQSIGSWGEPKVAIPAALSAGQIKPEGE